MLSREHPGDEFIVERAKAEEAERPQPIAMG
jgi:hypothetical protein